MRILPRSFSQLMRSPITPSILLVGLLCSCDSSSDSSTSSNSSSTSSSTTSDNSTFGTFTDARDNQTYRWVKIGTQTWMAQNLNFKVDSSWCDNNDTSNCRRYGRLYRWSSTMALSSHYDSATWGGSLPHQGICPSGWHVPSDAEWTKLTDTTLNPATACTVLRASSYWGTDSYAFSVLEYGSTFWSSSEIDLSHAQLRYFEYEDKVYAGKPESSYKSLKLSLRCLKN